MAFRFFPNFRYFRQCRWEFKLVQLKQDMEGFHRKEGMVVYRLYFRKSSDRKDEMSALSDEAAVA